MSEDPQELPTRPPYPVPPNCPLFHEILVGDRKGLWFSSDPDHWRPKEDPLHRMWSHDESFPIRVDDGCHMRSVVGPTAYAYWKMEKRRLSAGLRGAATLRRHHLHQDIGDCDRNALGWWAWGEKR